MAKCASHHVPYTHGRTNRRTLMFAQSSVALWADGPAGLLFYQFICVASDLFVLFSPFPSTTSDSPLLSCNVLHFVALHTHARTVGFLSLYVAIYLGPVIPWRVSPVGYGVRTVMVHESVTTSPLTLTPFHTHPHTRMLIQCPSVYMAVFGLVK